MKKENIITADMVKLTLQKRHTNDYFLTEVKTGPTFPGAFRIVDAIAVARSWAKPKVTIYEVKVNRQDFLRDKKYVEYFDFCNEFYFACAPDLISRDEIESEAGLIYSTGKSNRIIKKALFRPHDIPSDIFLYIIMSRLDYSGHPFYNNTAEYFRAWLDNRKSTRELGRRVKSKILRRIEELENIEEKYSQIKEQHDQLSELFEQYNAQGWGLKSKLENLLKREKVSFTNIDNVKRYASTILNAASSLSEIIKGEATG